MKINENISVIIASVNRAKILQDTLNSLNTQSSKPLEVILSVVCKEDHLEQDYEDYSFNLKICYAPKGLAAQRNYALKKVNKSVKYVTFIDDDMILDEFYLRNIVQCFEAHPNCVCIMGHLLANGNISCNEAKELLHNPPGLGSNEGKFYTIKETWGSLYGCNMSFRMNSIVKEKFDEKLPLYSEMEDVDIGTRIRKYGSIGYSFSALAVHLKVKTGRINYKMHGFSQIMNAMYLGKKGSIPMNIVIINIIIRKVVQNLFLIINFKQTKRRFHLIQGNLYAILCIIKGNIDPKLIFKIK